MKIIDLSVAIENDIPSDPPPLIPKVHMIGHKESADEMQRMFGNIGAENLPEGNGWGNGRLELTDHAGTHMDAPWHFYPTMNGGEPAWTVDQIPLEWCIGDGVVLDLSDKEDGYLVEPEDLERCLARINYTIKEGDIVLINTGAMRYWGTPHYIDAGCGISQEATLWLIEHGSRVMGTDAWGWDVPLKIAAERFAESKDPSIIWEGHRAGRLKAYCHLEKVANLDKLPPTGFKVICFPIKIKGGSAGWTRCVAILD